MPMQVDVEKKPSIEDGKKIGYEFKMISHHPEKDKCVPITHKKRLHISEISTVDIMARYCNGNTRQETLIPRVPTFLWDCFTPLFNCIQKNADINSEMFRKPGSGRRQRDFYHKNSDMHVRGCAFDRSNLSPLDIAEMMKAFIRERLEPIFFDGDPLLTEIDDLLSSNLGIEFDLEASPEFGTLLFVVKFLHAMCLKDPTAKRLTPDNLARVFAPNIIHIQHQPNNIGCETKQNGKHINIIAKLIANSQNLVVKEDHTVRVRRSSSSIDRMNKPEGGRRMKKDDDSRRVKKDENSRRSSSLFGRLVRSVIGERPRKVYGVEIYSLQTSSSSTPDSRQSRPRKKKTPNHSMRRDTQYSMDPSVEVIRRLSMKDNRSSTSPNGSLYSLTPSICYDLPFINEGKRLLQFTNSSLTTMPSGDDTLFSTVKGVFDAENSDKLPTPQMEEGYPLCTKSITDGSTDTLFQSLHGSDDFSPERPEPPRLTSYKSSIILTSSENSKQFITQADMTDKVSIELPLKPLITSRSSDNLSFKPPHPAPRKTDTTANMKKSTLKDDNFKAPFSLSGRSRSKSKLEQKYFGEDFGCIIMSAGTREEMDTMTNMPVVDRPSLALLKEQKRVTEQVAKLEKHKSVDERNSPKWPPRETPKVSSPRNFIEAPQATYSNDSLM